jgi:hypothetical protein
MAQVLEAGAAAVLAVHTLALALLLEELEIKVTAEEILDILAALLAVAVWVALAETLQMEEMLLTEAMVLIFMVRCMRRGAAEALTLKELVVAVMEVAVLVELVVITVALAEETLVAVVAVVDAAARPAGRVVQAE